VMVEAAAPVADRLSAVTTARMAAAILAKVFMGRSCGSGGGKHRRTCGQRRGDHRSGPPCGGRDGPLTPAWRDGAR